MKHVKSNDIHECVRGFAADGGSAAILETVKRLNADLSVENGFLAEKVLKATRRTTIHFAADEKRALAEAAHELQRMDLELRLLFHSLSHHISRSDADSRSGCKPRQGRSAEERCCEHKPESRIGDVTHSPTSDLDQLPPPTPL